MRALPRTLDRRVVADIDARLSSIGNDARILLAVESGSRAWGFPSPDSDYDCRFVYVRPLADYLRLSPPRDVIETPLDPVLDVNGWDLAKALRLLLKGNAVVIEWLMSPIVYRGEPEFRDDMQALARQAMRRPLIARHYLHLGLRMRGERLEKTAFRLKKVFYALRPAAALRWLALHPERVLPPMHFPTLMAECDPPPAVAAAVERLLVEKARTREMGEGVVPAEIARFVTAQFASAQREWGDDAPPLDETARRAADALFLKWVGAASVD